MFADELNAAIAGSGIGAGGVINGPVTINSDTAGTASGYWGLEANVTNDGPATGTAFKFGYLSRANSGGAYDIGFTNFATYTSPGTRQMSMWFMTVSPNDQTNPFACQVGEWNIVNRGPDCGWMADPSGRGHTGAGLLNATGGLTIIPMSDPGGAEGGGEGKNATFAFCMSGGPANSTGHPVKFYNGYIVSSDSIVGGTGRGMYLAGALSDPTQVPYGPIQIDSKWSHGIDHTLAVYTDTNATTMLAGQGVAWLTGTTGTPTNICRDTAGTGSPEGVVTANKGSTYRRFDGGAGTCFYVKESGTGNTGWVAK